MLRQCRRGFSARGPEARWRRRSHPVEALGFLRWYSLMRGDECVRYAADLWTTGWAGWACIQYKGVLQGTLRCGTLLL